MGWTAFVAEMNDGSMHSFGTSFSFEFFDLPEGYSYGDVKRIISDAIFSETDGLIPCSLAAMKNVRVYREKPFFTCYLDQLN